MKKLPLVARILLGFILGSCIGLLLGRLTSDETLSKILQWVSPFGDVLVAMLKMVVYPIIFFSLICGAASMPIKTSGKTGGLVMLWYFLTSVFATVFGVAMAFLLNPSMQVSDDFVQGNVATVNQVVSSRGVKTISDFFVGLFSNPFEALATGQFLPIIVFAIFFGLCARCILDSDSVEEKIKSSIKSVIGFCDGVQHISFKMIDCVIQYFPFGIFALSITNFSRNGTMLFGPYARITCSVVLCVLIMVFVIYPIAILVFCRENPYKVMLNFRNPILTAFVTRSSSATLPISFYACDNLGIKRSLSSFSLPMGATVNMDGVCIHLPVFVILAANIFSHQLSMLQIGTLCISILFASIGAGGIPGGSVFLLFMVLQAMQLPADQVTFIVALALGINPILDMFETACNVAGDNVCTYIVSKVTQKS
jgi:Na+/H+-dicarboxylate symporter